jgi:hypothetical protein
MRTLKLSGAVALGAGLLLLVAVNPAAAAIAKAKVKPITASNLKKLSNSVTAAKKLTYEATYKLVSDGRTTLVTTAQAPPKSVFLSGGAEVVDTGTATYYCSTSGATQSCLSAGTSNPYAALEDAFSPTLALTAFDEAKEGLVERTLGIKATSSSQTIAGQSSTCVTVSVRGESGKYCVTSRGLLAYSGSSTTSKSYFELVKYSGSPSSSLFKLPAGATTVTLPGGGSIP